MHRSADGDRIELRTQPAEQREEHGAGQRDAAVRRTPVVDVQKIADPAGHTGAT
jgi:hypothetical protein